MRKRILVAVGAVAVVAAVAVPVFVACAGPAAEPRQRSAALGSGTTGSSGSR
jgi:hypothetical protein